MALSPATNPDFIDESKCGILQRHYLKQKEKNLNVISSIGEKDYTIGPSREFNTFLKENHVGVEYRFVPEADHSWTFWEKEIIVAFDTMKKWVSLGENA